MGEDRKRLGDARQAAFNNLWCRTLRFLGERIADFLEPRKIHPNQVTLAAFGCIAAGALIALGGTPFTLALCSLFLFLAAVLDCTDGSLARRSGQSSRLGSYLDVTLDEVGAVVLMCGLSGGLWLAGFRGLAILAPVITYVGDIMIAHTMTRYREEFIDTLPQEQSTEAAFAQSPVLNLARQILPPFYPRQFLFPAFACLGQGVLYLFLDAAATVILAIGLMVKVGLDIREKESRENASEDEEPTLTRP